MRPLLLLLLGVRAWELLIESGYEMHQEREFRGIVSHIDEWEMDREKESSENERICIFTSWRQAHGNR